MDRSEKRQAGSGKLATVALEQHRFISKVIMSFASRAPLGSHLWGKVKHRNAEIGTGVYRNTVLIPEDVISELGHTVHVQLTQTLLAEVF